MWIQLKNWISDFTIFGGGGWCGATMLAKHEPHNTHWGCGVSRESRSVAGWTWCSCCLLSPSAHCDSDQDCWHGKNTRCRSQCSHIMCFTSVECVCVYVTLLGLGVWYRRRDLCSVQWLWRLFSEESKGERGTRNYEKIIHKITMILMITDYIVCTSCISAQFTKTVWEKKNYFVIILSYFRRLFNLRKTDPGSPVISHWSRLRGGGLWGGVRVLTD